MLRINTYYGIGPKSYFLYDDRHSYTDDRTGTERSHGTWFGKGAEMLGLVGEVGKEQFSLLCDNLHPWSRELLTLQSRSDRRVGFDFNFHVPKSVSVYYAITGDERVLEAFKEAVRSTMRDMEAEVLTRVRKGVKNRDDDRVTGNLVWGEFVHFYARPVDGKVDPHLHIHLFVMNATYDEVELCWKAVQPVHLFRDRAYWESIAMSRLAAGLRDLGLDVEQRGRAFELTDIPQSVIDKFSRRTKVIEEEAKARGIDDPAEKADLGRKTRRPKDEANYDEDPKDEWRSRMSEEEAGAFKAKPGRPLRPVSDRKIKQAVSRAIETAFERSATVRTRVLIGEILRAMPGIVTEDKVEAILKDFKVIPREVNGEEHFTTLEVLNEELEMVKCAQRGRGRYVLDPKDRPESVSRLNEDQQRAVRHVVESKDRVIILRGPSGSGKTWMLPAVRDWVKASMLDHYGVRVIASTAQRASQLVKEHGLKDTTTISEFLSEMELLHPMRRGFLIVDDAGTLGTKLILDVLKKTERLGCQVLLVGEFDQHGMIGRGSPLRTLWDDAGLGGVTVDEIVRQKGEYKQAVTELAEGKTPAGLSRLDKMGWVHEPKQKTDADGTRLSDEDKIALTIKSAAKDYVETKLSGQKCVAITPTHAEKTALTKEIRSLLREERKIGKSREYNVLESLGTSVAERKDSATYKAGQVIRFHQNVSGFDAGTEWKVKYRDPLGNVAVYRESELKGLPLRKAKSFDVFEPKTIKVAKGDTIRITQNAKVFGAVGHVFKDNVPHAVKKFMRKEITNGSCHEVVRFGRDGSTVLSNGAVLPKGFPHIDHGYCTTPSSARQTADKVILLETSMSGRAASDKQFYSSVARGKESVSIHTDDKDRLRNAVLQPHEKTSGLDILSKHERDRFIRKGVVHAESDIERNAREAEERRNRERMRNRDRDRERDREM